MGTLPTDGRETVSLMVDACLVERAKARGIDLDQAAEDGIAFALRRAEADPEAWREENREAIESWNAYVERHGLQLTLLGRPDEPSGAS